VRYCENLTDGVNNRLLLTELGAPCSAQGQNNVVVTLSKKFRSLGDLDGFALEHPPRQTFTRYSADLCPGEPLIPIQTLQLDGVLLGKGANASKKVVVLKNSRWLSLLIEHTCLGAQRTGNLRRFLLRISVLLFSWIRREGFSLNVPKGVRDRPAARSCEPLLNSYKHCSATTR
jgi:hypothetical protein